MTAHQAKSVVSIAHFPRLLNDQFWIWNRNNCAPAAFLVITELLLLRLGIEPKRGTKLQQALESRTDVLRIFAEQGKSPERFDSISKRYAGESKNCGHARPVFGCCQHVERMAYLELAHVLRLLIEGDLPLEDAFCVKRAAHPATKELGIIAMMAGDQSVMFRAIHYLRSIVGPPPMVLQVVLNNVEFAASTPSYGGLKQMDGN